MKKTWIWVGCITLIIVIGSISVVMMNNEKKTASQDPGYELSSVQMMDLSEKVDATGKVVLSKNMDIYPAFESTVVKIAAKSGDAIKKGDVLLILDSPTLQSQWAEANSSFRQAEINLKVAQKDLERNQILFNAQGTTIDQVEAAQSKVDIYREQLLAAQIKLDQIKVPADGANIIDPNHRNILIRAPQSGSVAWVNVKPGDKVTNQTVLLSLATDNSLAIEAEIDESEIHAVQIGQLVVISSDALTDQEIEGVVSEVGKIGTEDAGVIYFPVRIKVRENHPILQNGMSVDVTIVTSSRPNVLAVPSKAVVERRGHPMVAIRSKDGVVFTRVEVGVKSNGFTEIISGLNPGDTIVIQAAKAPVNSEQNNRNGNMRMMFRGGRGG